MDVNLLRHGNSANEPIDSTSWVGKSSPVQLQGIPLEREVHQKSENKFLSDN